MLDNLLFILLNRESNANICAFSFSEWMRLVTGASRRVSAASREEQGTVYNTHPLPNDSHITFLLHVFRSNPISKHPSITPLTSPLNSLSLPLTPSLQLPLPPLTPPPQPPLPPFNPPPLLPSTPPHPSLLIPSTEVNSSMISVCSSG